jgi:hypothetical protein
MCRNAWTFSRSPSDLVQTQHDLRQHSVSFAPPEPKPILWCSHCVLSQAELIRDVLASAVVSLVIEVFERWRQPRGPPHAAAKNRENAHDPHVMIQTSAAGAAPPATEPCAHLVIIGTDEAAFNGATCQQHQAEEQPTGSSAAILAPRTRRVVASRSVTPSSDASRSLVRKGSPKGQACSRSND